MNMTTTLNKILKHEPCEDGWSMLLENLGKTQADDEPLEFSTIVHSNCVADAIWCLRSICPEHEREVRLFAADCAEHVLHIFEKHYPSDKRPRMAIEAARSYADGEIDIDTLDTAGNAASYSTSYSTSVSSSYAALAAAWVTSRHYYWNAANHAANAAARATDDVFSSAAWDSARATQCKLLINRFS